MIGIRLCPFLCQMFVYAHAFGRNSVSCRGSDRGRGAGVRRTAGYSGLAPQGFASKGVHKRDLGAREKLHNSMNRLSLIVVFLLAAACAAANAAEHAKPATAADATAEFEHIKNWRGNPKEWKLAASLPEQEYVNGEKWPLKITVTNVSRSSQWLVLGGPWTDFYITVLDDNGWRVPLKHEYYDVNKRGLKMIEYSQRRVASSGNAEADIDLAECFDIDKPGTYLLKVERYLGVDPTLQARLGDPSGPKIVSEPIKLLITAKRSKPKPLPPDRISGPRLQVR